MNEDTTVMTVRPEANAASGGDAGPVKFTVNEPGKAPWHFSTSAQEIVVGRGARADLQIEHAAISRMHLRLQRSSSGTLRLTDLGSTNGTYINGVPVEVAVLCEGDLLSVGSKVTLAVSYGSEEVARRSHEDALANFERILADQTQKYGRAHRNVASTLEMIGSIHLARGAHGPGISALEEALSILRGLESPDALEASRVLASLGEAYIRAGDLAGGRRSVEEALRELDRDPDRQGECGRLRFSLARAVAANDPDYAQQIARHATRDLERAGLHAARREVDLWLELAS